MTETKKTYLVKLYGTKTPRALGSRAALEPITVLVAKRVVTAESVEAAKAAGLKAFGGFRELTAEFEEVA